MDTRVMAGMSLSCSDSWFLYSPLLGRNSQIPNVQGRGRYSRLKASSTSRKIMYNYPNVVADSMKRSVRC